MHPQKCMKNYVKVPFPEEIVQNIVLIFIGVCDNQTIKEPTDRAKTHVLQAWIPSQSWVSALLTVKHWLHCSADVTKPVFSSVKSRRGVVKMQQRACVRVHVCAGVHACVCRCVCTSVHVQNLPSGNGGYYCEALETLIFQGLPSLRNADLGTSARPVSWAVLPGRWG